MAGGPVIFGTTLFFWAIVAAIVVIKPIEYLKWVSWKKKARVAISNGQVAQCRICKDHIFPGQKVVRTHKEGTEGGFFVHISRGHTRFSLGGHFSLKSRYSECALLPKDQTEGQKNLGIWNGFQFISDPNSPQVS